MACTDIGLYSTHSHQQVVTHRRLCKDSSRQRLTSWVSSNHHFLKCWLILLNHGSLTSGQWIQYRNVEHTSTLTLYRYPDVVTDKNVYRVGVRVLVPDLGAEPDMSRGPVRVQCCIRYSVPRVVDP